MSSAGTQDEALLIAAAREFARAELLPCDREWDRGSGSVLDVLPTLAEMGFFNLLVPEEANGLGCSHQTYAAILHEIAYASPSAAVTLSVHNMVGDILAQRATGSICRTALARWGQADHFAAFAISEAGAGSNPASTRTRAERHGDAIRITGEKMWITNGLSARWFLTLVRTGAGKDGLSIVLVDGDLPGITRQPIQGKMGIRGSETALIVYDNVDIPAECMVGDEGAGLSVSLAALHGGRIGIAAQASGIAEACMDEMIRFAGEREQFGQPICGFPAIQGMVADSAVDLAAAKVLIHRAAVLCDHGINDAAASSMAKLFATEAANRIAARAVQVHGGMGYVNECRVEQLYRDARVTTIYEGTSEIQRLIIARELLKAR